MSPELEAARAQVRRLLLRAYVVETGLPPEMEQLLEAISRPAPAPPRRRLFGRSW